MATAATYLSNPLMFDVSATAVNAYGKAVGGVALGQRLPDAVRQWLARLRILEGVPFAHLVPDSDLLPPESIRFFYLDREWTDVLVQGALSVSTITTLDREQLQSFHLEIREEVDAEERRIRVKPPENLGFAAGQTISGFVLRSRAVSGWPALHVRAYRAEVGADYNLVPENHPDRMRLLRLERLAPAVLLCLFDGVPRIVRIEEPRQGVQFGVDDPNDGTGRLAIPLRDITDAERLDRKANLPQGTKLAVDVPFRSGAPGVLHIRELANRFAGEQQTHANLVGGEMQSAEFAMQMLQFPYRQVFGDTTNSTKPAQAKTWDELFRPTVTMADVRQWGP